jgi:hypothetical protein
MDDDMPEPRRERLARHTTSDDSLSYLDASDEDTRDALTVLQAAIEDAAASLGADAVVCAVESKFPSTFYTICGESLNYQLRQFVRDIMDGSISTNQSWKRLWSQVPGAIIVMLSKATSSDTETKSGLGQVRQDLLLTQSIQVVSLLCVMVNPNCTQISQAKVSLIMMSGKGCTQLGREVLFKLGVSTGHSASASQQLVLRDQGLEIVKMLIRLAVFMGLPLFLIFDNADWSKLADIAIHLVHYIVWFGDKNSPREMPVSMSLDELKEANFEESSDEVHAKNISDSKSNTYASLITADDEAECKVNV